MRTRYRVSGRTVRLEASDGSAAIMLELSRAGPGQSPSDEPGRSSLARAVCVGRGRSLSWSRAATDAAGRGEAQAEVAGTPRHRFKLSD
jgi:hypothetical protein